MTLTLAVQRKSSEFRAARPKIAKGMIPSFSNLSHVLEIGPRLVLHGGSSTLDYFESKS